MPLPRRLKPKLPAPYPLAELELANRVAVIGAKEGWCPAYVKSTYQRWFEDGHPAGSEPNLSESIAEAGADPGNIIARARSVEGTEGLASATDEARRLGIFGAPSFVVGDELFWGDDRLDDALAWRRTVATTGRQ
jgi:2-hydroxychromene-2-carboxylate isomerase